MTLPTFVPLALVVAGIAAGAGFAQPAPDAAQTLRALEQRARRQATAIARSPTFHDFRFSDQRAASGITFTHQAVDDAGKNWKPAHYDHGSGIAVADVDGDGRYDIYFPNQMGRSELWRNLGQGRFENITGSDGLAMENQVCVGASFGDLDNDGDPDLFVTTVRQGNRLFENLGAGRFRDATSESGLGYAGHSSGAVLFDFDRDGLLDVFVANPGIYTIDQRGAGGFFLSITNAFHGHIYAERTEQKLLYRNKGKLRFENFTAEAGLQDGSWSGEASFADLNNDSYPDLYLVNMQGDDRYYENQGGRRFAEATGKYFAKSAWGAMGLKFFDFNNDSELDLYVTDMHSDMTPEQTLRGFRFETRMEKSKSEAFCMARWDESFLQGSSNNLFGNAFYVNRGNGRFDERSDGLNAETYWPWGPSVGDVNADGFQDVFVTAGMGYPFRYAVNSLLLNDRGERFQDAEFATGIEPRLNGRIEKTYFTLECSGADREHPLCAGKSGLVPVSGTLSSRSSAVFDLDDDGDLDIVVGEMHDQPQILVSNLSERRKIHWLKLALRGTRSNRDGLGARVVVSGGGKQWMQYVDGKSGYLGQSVLPLYFGLGDVEQVEKIEVVWPSGQRQEIRGGVKLNSLLRIEEPRGN